MLTQEEIGRSLRAIIAMFRGRREGLDSLDRSVDGFWRSFLTILLVFPIYAATMLGYSRIDPDAGTFGALVVSGLPALVLDYVAFPLLLLTVAEPLGIGRHFASFVVARNWASPLAALLLFVPVLLEAADVVPREGATLLTFIALIVVVRLFYLIARIALSASVSLAIGVVAADLILSIFFGALLS